MPKKQDTINLILKSLIENIDYITVSQLAGLTGYTTRSIYTLLKSNDFQNRLYGATIEKKPNKGIRLNVDKNQKNKILNYLNQQILSSNQVVIKDIQDRNEILLSLLLSQNETTANIAQNLYKSNSSTLDIINKIENELHPYCIHIQRKPNIGLSLVGKEKDIRNLFLQTILEKLDIKSKKEKPSRDNFFKQMNEIFSSNIIEVSKEIINSIEISINTKLVDYDYYLLFIKLVIIIIRNKLGYILNEKYTIIKDIQEYFISLYVQMSILSYFNIQLNDNEVASIEKTILSLRRQSNDSIIYVFDEKIVDSFISHVSNHLNVDLNNDVQLRNSLISHLKPAIRRMKYGITSENPLLEQIKEKHTEIYIAIITTIEYIEETESIFFDSNEIGYICLHIVAALNRAKQTRTIRTLLLCESGITFESYLKSLIEYTFQEIEIDEICDYSPTLSIESFDLVLNSTNQIIDEEKVIKIDQLLNEQSCSNIRHWLLEKELNKKIYLENQLKNYLLFFDDYDIKTKNEFLSNFCSFLETNNYVTKEYKKSVEDRMKQSATSIGRGIALPHGAKKYVLKSTILAIKLKQPIEWENQNIDFVFFAVIGNDISTDYTQIFRKIIRIVSDDEKTYQLKNCHSLEEIKNLLF